MNPFHSIYHPELDQENLTLEYEEEPESMYTEPKRRSKRRKLSNDVTPMRVTRSAKKTNNVVEKTRKPAVEEKEKDMQAASVISPSKMMPPPKTPTKPIRREIPSSQTPPDTPISIRSRHSNSDQFISPLKNKSTNFALPNSLTNTPKKVRWATTKVVPDSMESEGLSRITSKSSNESLKTERASVKSPPSSQPAPKASGDPSLPETLESGVRETMLEDEDRANMSNGFIPSASHYEQESIIQVASSPAPQRTKIAPSPSSGEFDHANEDIEQETDIDIDGSPVPTPPDSPPINTNPVRIEYPSDNEDGASHQLLPETYAPTLPAARPSLQQEAQYQGYDTIPPSSSLQSAHPDDTHASEHSHTTVPTQLLPGEQPANWQKPLVPPSQATTVDVTQPSPILLESDEEYAASQSEYAGPEEEDDEEFNDKRKEIQDTTTEDEISSAESDIAPTSRSSARAPTTSTIQIPSSSPLQPLLPLLTHDDAKAKNERKRPRPRHRHEEEDDDVTRGHHSWHRGQRLTTSQLIPESLMQDSFVLPTQVRLSLEEEEEEVMMEEIEDC